MKSKQFDKVVKRRCKLIKAILSNKEKEYAQDNDRFHNFKVAAAIDGEEPEQALWGMFKKHLVSIRDIKNDPDNPLYTKAFVDEKVGDAIDYLVLFEGLLKERRKNK